MSKFAALFQPGYIGKMRLENRLVMSAMGNFLADEEGYPTQSLLDYYRVRAAGGVGLIVTQFASVSSDATPLRKLALYEDKFPPALRKLVEVIHKEGAKVCIQLMHYGLLLSVVPKSLRQGMPIMVPTIMPWMAGDDLYRELDEDDIDRYVEDFSEAARRAREAGADAVELHACHACLVSTFLSPATNRRNDRYGGNVENRARFASRILGRIREKVGPGFPLSVRINCTDDVHGGVSLDEMKLQAVALQAAGADAISLSGGHEYASPLTIPGHFYSEGPMVPLAEEVKKVVQVPVITAGKISPELGEQIIGSGKADFIALGRPLLADPELPNKLRQGRVEDVRRCIYCNNCIGAALSSCTVNPFLHRESSLPLTPAATPKKVIVIGGGLGGMQAAVLLAQRGHRVSLYEKEHETGGQWNPASGMPGKKDYASFSRYLRRSLEEQGVKITLGVEATAEKVLEAGPDVVVVATGAVEAGLDVPGASGRNVVQANDVIVGKVSVGSTVVVVGGRFLGMEMAVWLAEQGEAVSLVTRGRLGGAKGPGDRRTYMYLVRRLVELRVPLHLNTRVIEVTETGVVVAAGELQLHLPADTVVLAVGARADQTLARQLEGRVPELYMVGDCVEPRHAASATYEAASLALRI